MEKEFSIQSLRRGIVLACLSPDLCAYRRSSGVKGTWAISRYIGSIKYQYPSESAAKAAVDSLRLTINIRSARIGASLMTVQSLWQLWSAKTPSSGF